MAIVTFDPAVFRAQFPAFSSETDYPDATLQGYFNRAICYINPNETACFRGDCLVLALNALTAHICVLSENATQGKGSGVATSASIGGVSVSLAPPPFGSSQWSWWLNTTPYGAELQALLSQVAAPGFLYGSLPERHAFRKVGGRF